MSINLSTSNFNDGVKSARDAYHLSSWAPLWWVHCSKQCFCKDIHLCMGMCQQTLQVELAIHEGLTAQKYNDEIVGPHVKSHVNSNALGDSTVYMRGGTKPHTARISLDVLANAINLLLSAKNPDSNIIACVQKHEWYESISVNCCWATCNSARWMEERYTGKHTLLVVSVQRGLHAFTFFL